MTNDGIILECDGTLIPQVGGLSCVIPAGNCTTYDDADNQLCKVCNAGVHFLGDDKLCYDCSDAIDGLDTRCTVVTNDGIITTCSGDDIPQHGAKSCVTPALNCQTFDSSDKALCDICNDGVWYNSNSLCRDCSIDFDS